MQTQPQYFDLHTSGIGYMSRLRLVQPDKSKGQKFKPFWSVSISAICGEENDVKYVKFDLNIKGDQAKQAMDVLKPYLIDDEGKPLVCLKGRLLKLTSAKVNGQVVELPKTEHDEAKEAGAAQAAQSAE